MEEVTITVNQSQEKVLTFPVPSYFKESSTSIQLCRLNAGRTITSIAVSDNFVQLTENPYPGISKIVLFPQVEESEWNETLIKAKKESDKFFAENIIPSREEIQTK